MSLLAVGGMPSRKLVAQLVESCHPEAGAKKRHDTSRRRRRNDESIAAEERLLSEFGFSRLRRLSEGIRLVGKPRLEGHALCEKDGPFIQREARVLIPTPFSPFFHVSPILIFPLAKSSET